MSFSVFPAWLALGGAVALAGLLFLLQRLRVRPRVVVLPSAVLWRVAVSQAQPRALFRRFHDLLAYLLILAIALALWLAAAGLGFPPSADSGRHLFYLDNSVLLTTGESLAQAERALLADVARVPAAQREVVLGDATGQRLLAPGEELGLLEQRLKPLAAEVRPSSFLAWADTVLAQRAGPPATLHYYGAWPAAAPLAARLNHDAEGARFAWGYAAPAVTGNRGIVTLGERPSRSGHWGRVDVLIGTLASEGPAPDPSAWSITLDGKPMDLSTTPMTAGPGPGLWTLRDVAADGRVLRVALRQGDAFTADDAATLKLPLIQRVKVAVGARVPDAVTEVIRRDPALELADLSRAQVLVLGPGEVSTSPKPSLRLVPAKDQSSAFVLTRPGRVEQSLTVDVAELGLSGLDAGALADRLNRSIGIDVAQGPRRDIAVWDELFGDAAGFTRSAAMPIFVSRSLRWLAEPPVGTSSTTGSGTPTGRPMAMPLLDAQQSLAAAQPVPADLKAQSERVAASGLAPGRWTTELLLVLAALLLVAEWHAVRRGRMA